MVLHFSEKPQPELHGISRVDGLQTSDTESLVPRASHRPKAKSPMISDLHRKPLRFKQATL